MTANKSSKAVPCTGGGKVPRDNADRSVTPGTDGLTGPPGILFSWEFNSTYHLTPFE